MSFQHKASDIPVEVTNVRPCCVNSEWRDYCDSRFSWFWTRNWNRTSSWCVWAWSTM